MRKKLFAIILLTLFSSSASAHSGNAILTGFYEGFMHPIAGLDHLIMMVAVGLLAAQSEKYMRWLLPITFIAMMAVGGVLGVSSGVFHILELLIALTIFIMGCMLLFSGSVSSQLKLLLVSLFALPHGWAHGVEIGTNGLSPLFGLLIATVLLHIIGAFCWQAQPLIKLSINRLAGSVMLVAGGLLILN